MSEELSYILITPHSITKSRTGGILARIISQTSLDLVGAQIATFDQEFVSAYANSLRNHTDYGLTADNAKLLSEYMMENLLASNGCGHRVMLLLLKGENAVAKLYNACGSLFDEDCDSVHHDEEIQKGETIRDTYADLIWADKTKKTIKYFEPAVLVVKNPQKVKEHLQMFSSYLKNVSNIVPSIRYKNPDKIQKTLVIIKPDNWAYASSRPGSIIDMFSRTGLRIVGCKIFRMSVSQAIEFYGPVKDVLIEKLSPVFAKKAQNLLEKEFDLHFDDECKDHLMLHIGKKCAIDQFEKIIEFMSGTQPSQCPADELSDQGKVKCMILIYEGEDAVEKIRETLGPTDPTKAPSGTIRKEFGHDVMINSAHASDSAENAKREMNIVKIDENTLSSIIDSFYP
ncbi:MAG: nucleoside-diphosphate kinase [Treponemataceae bacterium]